MRDFGGWVRALIITGGALTVTACASYPSEPRYSIRADQPSRPAPVAQPVYPGQPGQAYPGTAVVTEAPPPQRAPIADIEGGSLPSPATTSGLNGSAAYPSARPTPASPAPIQAAPSYSPPPYTPPATASAPSASGALAYVIQPGDTISGVGRRFQTPVQTLIDLNNLGPQAAITPGQRVVLPDSAVDTGADPYATGPAPVGVTVPRGGSIPPPPPPPSGNPALPAAMRPVAPRPVTPPPARPAAPSIPAPQISPSAASPVVGAIPLQWPVRGDIVKPFGPVAMGERNNGVNIGASAGAPVNAAAPGRVAYVGDDTGQGLTVIIAHRDGWRTVYAQLGSTTVENNADVRAGQQIGTVGVTAGDGRPSIHFETRHMQGDNPLAVDPLTVLPR